MFKNAFKFKVQLCWVRLLFFVCYQFCFFLLSYLCTGSLLHALLVYFLAFSFFLFFCLLPLLQPSHHAPPSLLIDAPFLLTDMAMAHQAPLMNCMAAIMSGKHRAWQYWHAPTLPCHCTRTCYVTIPLTAALTMLQCPLWLHSPCCSASYGCMHHIATLLLLAYPLLIYSLNFFSANSPFWGSVAMLSSPFLPMDARPPPL